MKYLLALSLLVSSVSFAQNADPQVGQWKFQDKNVYCPTCYYMATQKLKKEQADREKQNNDQEKGLVRKGV